jgi:uracil-DNA glycosylase
MKFSLDEVDVSWHRVFTQHIEHIQSILQQLEGEEIAPPREHIFRAFRQPLESVRVLIVGQDPYPTLNAADGLAFSFSSTDQKLPASLRNIFREYSDDLQVPTPNNGDLGRWSENGVMLLNRTLTTLVGERNTHVNLGWKLFTDSVASYLGERGVIAILWGTHAQELSPFFKEYITSAHPSPLSAYRGFFGSKPFSRVNEILIGRGRAPIDWTL